MVLSIVAATGVILGAVYMPLAVPARLLGPGAQGHRRARARGISRLREWVTVAPLLVAIVWIGFNPQPLLNVVKEPVDAFVQRVSRPPARPRADSRASAVPCACAGAPAFAPAQDAVPSARAGHVRRASSCRTARRWPGRRAEVNFNPNDSTGILRR